jgi:osmotically inducible lipoprotein OsmB
MRKITLAILAVSALALAGCGTSPGERAVTGGLLGAGAGAAIGAATGNPAAGAAIGGVAGAVGGAVTSPCDVDLNAPGGRRDCR